MASLSRNFVLVSNYACTKLVTHHLRILSTPNLRPLLNSQQKLSYIFSTLTNVPTCDVHKTILPSSHVNNYLIQRRFRKKRGRGAKKDDDDEEENDDDDDDLAQENPLLVDDLLDGPNDGSQSLKIDVNSLRMDGICKAAFNITRAKVEESFYKGEIYINGERPAKKSAQVSLNDEIDLIKGANEENNKLVDIRRVVITSLPDKETETGRLKIGVKRWMDLTVERPGTQEEE